MQKLLCDSGGRASRSIFYERSDRLRSTQMATRSYGTVANGKRLLASQWSVGMDATKMLAKVGQHLRAHLAANFNFVKREKISHH